MWSKQYCVCAALLAGLWRARPLPGDSIGLRFTLAVDLMTRTSATLTSWPGDVPSEHARLADAFAWTPSSHRVKNVLAQVAVVAASTSQGGRSIDAFLRSFKGILSWKRRDLLERVRISKARSRQRLRAPTDDGHVNDPVDRCRR
jgi:hypothetical protein